MSRSLNKLAQSFVEGRFGDTAISVRGIIETCWKAYSSKLSIEYAAKKLYIMNFLSITLFL